MAQELLEALANSWIPALEKLRRGKSRGGQIEEIDSQTIKWIDRYGDFHEEEWTEEEWSPRSRQPTIEDAFE
jgi:hypothetical protein